MSQISNNDKISALNNAIASVEMEGFRFADGEKELCMDALKGKITKEDFIKILLERCRV
ncbi:MAG: antitoxin VbhA family protein [Clostridia bacterium]|nr:antitoxin VbhA family protein [Clostridia bacterium]